jgi:hypothetical protein
LATRKAEETLPQGAIPNRSKFPIPQTKRWPATEPMVSSTPLYFLIVLLILGNAMNSAYNHPQTTKNNGSMGVNILNAFENS